MHKDVNPQMLEIVENARESARKAEQTYERREDALL